MSIFSEPTLQHLKLRTTTALLLHEIESQGGNSRYRQLATVHPVHYINGEKSIGAGKSLGLQRRKELVRVLNNALKHEDDVYLPPEVLSFSANTLSWYVPGKVRQMSFQTDSHRGQYLVPWPTLVFCVVEGSLSLAALRGRSRPQADTPLYFAPLMNVSPDGLMCWGDVAKPRGWQLDDRRLYEAAVFDSNFSHTANNSHTLRGEKASTERLLEFWQGLHSAGATRFPTRALNPMPRKWTLQHWMRAHAQGASE